MGYDPHFIPGIEIPLPRLAPSKRAQAFNAGIPIEHTRFSVIFDALRGFAMATAHNIDGATLIEEGVIPRNDRFRLDPDVPRILQVDDDRGYRSNPWDRGHLVRRSSLHWGDLQEATEADAESYFWTNITPQHERLHDTAWGRIEDWMLGLVEESESRVAVFTGPVLSADDPAITNRPGEEPFQLPAGFWKVLALRHRGRLRAAAFLVWQRDFDREEPVTFDPVLEQVRLTTVEYLTGLSFDALRLADPMRPGDDRGSGLTGEPAPSPNPSAINEPGDILL